MQVAELWRYPVKSLAGERLATAALGIEGIPGDRVLDVRDARGRLVTARTRPRLLALHGSIGPSGEPLIDGISWEDPRTAARVGSAVGDGARLTRASGIERFDDTPLLIATDGAIAHLGIDGRRLRPNIVLAGVEGLAERAWPGSRLRLGEALIAVEKVCKRCIVTTLDPDTQVADPEILRRIERELDGRAALNCHVIEPGRVAVGDRARLECG